MAQDAKDNRILLNEKDTRTKILEGAKASYDAVTATFGPRGKNVLLEKPFGRPMLTRDGVTVARDVYFSDRSKNMGAQLVLEASEVTNRIAGDGTTGTVALSYNLLKNGAQAIEAGVHPMEVKAQLLNDQNLMLDKLAKLAKPVKKGQLLSVATVSSGDPLLGQLISEAVERVGADGGILAEKAPLDDIEREFVNGYYLQSGFQALQSGKKELGNPFVIVTIRRLSSAADIADVLTKALQAFGFNPQTDGIPRFLIVGNVEDGAYINAVNLINQGKIDAIVVKSPPQFGEMSKQLLEDIAVYAGCSPITDTTNLRELNKSFVGTVDKVVSNKTETTIFSDNKTEAIQTRVQEIKDQLETETVDAVSEKLRDRVAKLEGKIALFRIGGATDTSKEEKEFRIEDAIHATRAAASDGVVPGGCTTLLELSKLEGLSEITRKSLRDTFKRLLVNANQPAEVKLEEALKADYGFGFNLRGDGELVDMVKAGILDPKLVIEQVVKNSTQTAADSLSIGVSAVFEDKKD
jgi:chaperonin GroEL